MLKLIHHADIEFLVKLFFHSSISSHDMYHQRDKIEDQINTAETATSGKMNSQG